MTRNGSSLSQKRSFSKNTWSSTGWTSQAVAPVVMLTTTIQPIAAKSLGKWGLA